MRLGGPGNSAVSAIDLGSGILLFDSVHLGSSTKNCPYPGFHARRPRGRASRQQRTGGTTKLLDEGMDLPMGREKSGGELVSKGTSS